MDDVQRAEPAQENTLEDCRQQHRTAEIIKRIDPEAKIGDGAFRPAGGGNQDHAGDDQVAGKLDLFHWVIYHGYSGTPIA